MHRHDELDQRLLRFIVEEGDTFRWALTPATIRDELVEKYPEYAKQHQVWLRQVINRRMYILKQYGWIGSNRRATSKAKEAHTIWLWAGIVDMKN